MSGFETYILDFLGEFGSGRGDPADEYVRFGLGTVFFGILFFLSLRNRAGPKRIRETFLAIGFGLGLSREFFKLVIKSLELHGGVATPTLELFFPPLEHALFTLSRVLIIAGFAYFFIESRRFAERFAIVGSGLVLLFYLWAAPTWWSIVAATPTAKFSHFIGDWVIHIFGAGLGIFAVVIFLSSRKTGQILASIAFLAFLLDDILQLFNLGTGEVNKTVYGPIRHNLHIWSIFLLGAIYLREQVEERRRIEAELQRRERLDAVGQVTAGVAHDFNNILQIIAGYSEIARLKDETQIDALNQIDAATKRGAELVAQLLTFSRLDMSEPGVTNADETISEMLDLLAKVLGAEVHIDVRLNAPGAFVPINQTRLEQLITNLIVNARDAMPNGGTLMITSDIDVFSKSEGPLVDSVRITIEDSGVGMSKSTLDRIFQPFFTTKSVGGGTGLGLSTVQGIVGSADGTIDVQSVEGEGTRFTVHLPLSDTRPKNPKVEATPQAQLTEEKTILVAEDETPLLNLVTRYLSEAEYRVLPTENGTDAVRLAASHGDKIDALLLDVSMPSMTGHKAYEQILANGLDLPIVFMTGHIDRDENEYGAAILEKPFSRDKLLSVVSDAIHDHLNAKKRDSSN